MPDYPFVPKSNRYLRPGQFWALPLSDGCYGCGRVMVASAFEKGRVDFVAGLSDWIGAEPPNPESIAGSAVVMQAKTHIDAIRRTGGSILGIRPLELDDLVAIDPFDYRVGAVHRVWGWRTIANHAERLRDKPS